MSVFMYVVCIAFFLIMIMGSETNGDDARGW